MVKVERTQVVVAVVADRAEVEDSVGVVVQMIASRRVKAIIHPEIVVVIIAVVVAVAVVVVELMVEVVVIIVRKGLLNPELIPWEVAFP